MAAGSTYTPIATTTLGSAASSYTFSSIPSTYTDLVLIVSATVSAGSGGRIQFNSDTGSNYSNTQLSGTGTAASSSRDSSAVSARFTYEGSIGVGDANRNLSVIQIQNYANTTTYKTFLARANRVTTGLDAIVGMWRSTSAINSVTLFPFGDNFSTGCTFTLYGIASA